MLVLQICPRKAAGCQIGTQTEHYQHAITCPNQRFYVAQPSLRTASTLMFGVVCGMKIFA